MCGDKLMKKLLLITALLFTVGCKQEVVVKIDNTELNEMKAKAESLQAKVDSLQANIKKNEKRKNYYDIIHQEIGYMAGQYDATKKKKNVRIKEVRKGHFVFSKTPWDDDTKCVTCGDTIVFTNDAITEIIRKKRKKVKRK